MSPALLERSSLPVAYRLDGVKAVPLGQAEKCLIDAYGLRWYDPGLLEAQPGCLPVWHASKDKPEVSCDVNATRARINPNGSLQALPLGDHQFLVRSGAKLHRLDAQGVTPPSSRSSSLESSSRSSSLESSSRSSSRSLSSAICVVIVDEDQDKDRDDDEDRRRS